jgi:hypothetical protein
VEVVDDDDQRPATSQRLEQPPDRPRDFLARRGLPSRPRHARQPLCHKGGVLLALQQVAQPDLSARHRDLANYLGDWPVGQALPVLDAAAAQDRPLSLNGREKLLDQARLPHARRAQYEYQVTGAFGHGGSQGSVQQPKLHAPAHHRRFQVTSVPQDVRSDAE